MQVDRMFGAKAASGVVGGGAGTPVPPLDMHPPRPPLEQEVGTRTNLFNLHIYS